MPQAGRSTILLALPIRPKLPAIARQFLYYYLELTVLTSFFGAELGKWILYKEPFCFIQLLIYSNI